MNADTPENLWHCVVWTRCCISGLQQFIPKEKPWMDVW